MPITRAKKNETEPLIGISKKKSKTTTETTIDDSELHLRLSED